MLLDALPERFVSPNSATQGLVYASEGEQVLGGGSRNGVLSGEAVGGEPTRCGCWITSRGRCRARRLPLTNEPKIWLNGAPFVDCAWVWVCDVVDETM